MRAHLDGLDAQLATLDHELAQIAEQLHRSEGAVKLLMFRARQALKECLSRKASPENQP